MSSCPQASDRPCAAKYAGIVFWKEPPWRFRDFTKRLWRLISLALVILTPLLSHAQTTNWSREVSIFDFGQPAANDEAISREVSVFDFGQATAPNEAVSREVSVFDFGQPTANYEAVSREVSVFDFGQPTASSEAVSREVSVFDFGQAAASVEAISREVSVFDRGSNLLDSVSREVSVHNYGFNSLNIAIGSTVVLSGTSGGVPVTFSTQFPVTNVQVAVGFPQNLLTNWSVQPQSPLTATLMSNSSSLYLTFTPPNGQSIANTQQLGQISFTAISNQPSAFLPLPVADIAAPMLDGTTYTPYATAQDGEVVVLHTNSLLRMTRGTNGQEYLTLYGFSGTNYTIEATTNLSPPTVWQPVYTDLLPVNFIAITPDIGTTNPAMFYRAKQ